MSRIGIFVDTCDLYHKVQRNFGRDKKVRFDIFLDHIAGGDWEAGYIYGMRSDSQGFYNYLKSLGFSPLKFKPPRVLSVGDKQIKICDWSVTLVMDVIKELPNLDTVILGSSNGLLLPFVNYIRENDVEIIIVASGIPDALRKAANSFVELTEDDLEHVGEADAIAG